MNKIFSPCNFYESVSRRIYQFKIQGALISIVVVEFSSLFFFFSKVFKELLATEKTYIEQLSAVIEVSSYVRFLNDSNELCNVISKHLLTLVDFITLVICGNIYAILNCSVYYLIAIT